MLHHSKTRKLNVGWRTVVSSKYSKIQTLDFAGCIKRFTLTHFTSPSTTRPGIFEESSTGWNYNSGQKREKHKESLWINYINMSSSVFILTHTDDRGCDLAWQHTQSTYLFCDRVAPQGETVCFGHSTTSTPAIYCSLFFLGGFLLHTGNYTPCYQNRKTNLPVLLSMKNRLLDLPSWDKSEWSWLVQW